MAKRTAKSRKNERKERRTLPEAFHRVVPIVLAALAIFIGVCFVLQNDTGLLGPAISGVLLGLFSIGGYLIPAFLIVHAIFYMSDVKSKKLVMRVIFSLLALLAASALTHTIANWSLPVEELVFDPSALYTDGVLSQGGGFLGGAIAFGLIKIMGRAGVIVFTSLVFLIYIASFFTKGATLLDLGRSLIYGILAVLAFFERCFKKLAASMKKSKSEKVKEAGKASNAALSEDDFFDVDNGMESFEVPELGIVESRSRESIEENPTLHETVHHRSAEDRAERVRTSSAAYSESTYREDAREDDYVVEEQTEKAADTAPFSDLADDIFARAFDPFDIAANEELANKPSSRAAAEYTEPTVTERIESISEEEYNRRRREEEFERRKRAVIDTEREARQKTVEFSVQDTEYNGSIAVEDTVSVTIEKTAQHTEKSTDGLGSAEGIYETVYAPIGRGTEARSSSGFVFEFDRDTATEPEAITVERTVISGHDTPSPAADMRSSYEQDGYTHESADEELYEEKSNESEAAADAPVIEDATPYEFSLERDDQEVEAEPEEEAEEPREIPPEEQNPYVIDARKMFDIFRDEPEVTAGDEDENAREEIEDEEDVPFEVDEPNVEPAPSIPTRPAAPKAEAPKAETPKRETPKKPDYSNYKFPPIDLLAPGEVASDDGASEEIREKSHTIIDKLAEFNVTATIKSVDRGPRITRYEVVPATGVKVAQVTSLYNDIKLALATDGVRMLAPVPGKSAVGFEVPNKKAVTVRLRELLENDAYKDADSTTFVCMGKDVSGKPVFADIAEFPHAVVAGATGTGKSVCMNSLLISILYRARPDEVKFILIDPKRVEFNMYNGIPHLLVPVVTEPKQAAGALMWACNEMERRYTLIQGLNVRNIRAYNEKVKENPSLGEFLPKIVIVIDELSNLMLEVKDPVEGLIDKIAAMARAAGIHLLLGTQRPDTNVISGKIKNNINVRISCKVTSLVDSRTVLDTAGAEKLLGKGDLLFKTERDPAPVRLQSCFVADDEVEAIMDYLKQYSTGEQYSEDVIDEINRAAKKCGNQKGGAADEDDEESSGSYYGDPEFIDAVEYCIRAGQASASNLQIKMKIGFQRASRYITQMEEIGVVSEKKGQKPRDVLITIDEWHEKLSRVEID